MKIELKEHELERALEIYLQGLFKHPVKVNGFDLSGIRSKDGVSAMIDIDIEGETDVRPPKTPKTETSNVDPVNITVDEKKSKTTVEEPLGHLNKHFEKSEDYYKVLEYLSENPKNRNRKHIEELTRDNLDLVSQLMNVALYQDFLNRCVKEDAMEIQEFVSTISEEEPKVKNTEGNNSDTYGAMVYPGTLNEEEKALDELVLGDSNLQENDDGAVSPYQVGEPDLDAEAEEALVKSMVTTVGEEPKRTIVDDILEDKPEEPKKSLFGEPLNKPTRKLFG